MFADVIRGITVMLMFVMLIERILQLSVTCMDLTTV